MNRISLNITAALGLAATLILNSGLALAAESVQISTSQADSDLDAALKNLVATPGGPAGVIAIVNHGNQREVHRFGVGDLRNGTLMHANYSMRIASVAKAFSGAAALALVSKGLLSLDDTIGARLPDLPAAWSKVTLRQLLGHTSGLPDFSQSRKFVNTVLANPTDPLPPRKLLTFVESRDLKFPPGSRFKYSNSDNIVVALMIKAATETSYEKQLKEQVLKPLGLRRTSLPVGPELPRPFIHGYTDKPRKDVSEFLAAGWSWASGGVVSTPADLNEFIRAYASGSLIDSATLAEQRKVIEGTHSEPPGPGKNSAGLGIFRYETRCGTV